jgi:uncharacterized membrane protein
MTYSLVRLLHIAAMILWLGGGFSLPPVRDVRRSLALGREAGAGVVARLETITRLVVPAAAVTVLSGLLLIWMRGGFAAVPPRIHAGLAIALSIFAVGGLGSRPAIRDLGEAFAAGDMRRAEDAARRFARWVRLEDALRFTVLVLMVVPL